MTLRLPFASYLKFQTPVLGHLQTATVPRCARLGSTPSPATSPVVCPVPWGSSAQPLAPPPARNALQDRPLRVQHPPFVLLMQVGEGERLHVLWVCTMCVCVCVCVCACVCACVCVCVCVSERDTERETQKLYYSRTLAWDGWERERVKEGENVHVC